jgi:hypothetical protein
MRMESTKQSICYGMRIRRAIFNSVLRTEHGSGTKTATN